MVITYTVIKPTLMSTNLTHTFWRSFRMPTVSLYSLSFSVLARTVTLLTSKHTETSERCVRPFASLLGWKRLMPL